MQVLKFGGTSVANAENINKVVTIVKSALQKDRCIAVVSALGGITDTLLSAAVLAAEGNESYKEKLQLIEHRHISASRIIAPNPRSHYELW
jgi:bifunctional aspartokinase / homoserine dehydrogenase 1